MSVYKHISGLCSAGFIAGTDLKFCMITFTLSRIGRILGKMIVFEKAFSPELPLLTTETVLIVQRAA
ncbi:hypothetical protein [Gracilibacillus thailandensis]|uniref:hypothetical protein n=1 Tax=Gracilibacillus thailandensis TaxID=563735 RepID=UPI0013CFCA68|nr:hypothetical protein [Gracilibacillus thailandensis]